MCTVIGNHLDLEYLIPYYLEKIHGGIPGFCMYTVYPGGDNGIGAFIPGFLID